MKIRKNYLKLFKEKWFEKIELFDFVILLLFFQIQSLSDEKLRLAFQQGFILSFYDLFLDFNRAKQYLDVCF